MFTPRLPVKRKLVFTPYGSAKKARPTRTAYVRRFNKTTVRGPSKAGPLTQQVKALQAFANRFKPEKKYFETALALTNLVEGTGGILNLVSVAEGTGENDRIGWTINVHDIKINIYYSTSEVTFPAATAFIRFALVVDKEQVADTAPTAGNVFSGATPGAFPTIQFLERFKILYVSPQLSGRMANVSTATHVPTRSNCQEYTWSGMQKVQFNGTSGSDIEKNGIYLVVLLDGFSSTLDTGGTCRISFTDV